MCDGQTDGRKVYISSAFQRFQRHTQMPVERVAEAATLSTKDRNHRHNQQTPDVSDKTRDKTGDGPGSRNSGQLTAECVNSSGVCTTYHATTYLVTVLVVVYCRVHTSGD